jgi:hypothetical protein
MGWCCGLAQGAGSRARQHDPQGGRREVRGLAGVRGRGRAGLAAVGRCLCAATDPGYRSRLRMLLRTRRKGAALLCLWGQSGAGQLRAISPGAARSMSASMTAFCAGLVAGVGRSNGAWPSVYGGPGGCRGCLAVACSERACAGNAGQGHSRLIGFTCSLPGSPRTGTAEPAAVGRFPDRADLLRRLRPPFVGLIAVAGAPRSAQTRSPCGDIAGDRLAQVPVRRDAAGAALRPRVPSADRTGHCGR